MWWQVVAGLSALIALCFLGISGLTIRGLVQANREPSHLLSVGTATISALLAVHYGKNALYLVLSADAAGADQRNTVRAVFGGFDSVLVELLVAVAAVGYLMTGRRYGWNASMMFGDRTRAAAEQQFPAMAATDQVTGVPNRAAYQGYADSLTDDEDPVIVLLIDFGGLKAFNDEYGRDAGDRLLRDMAQRLAGGLRGRERLFRLGGGEFALIGVGHNSERAADLFTRTEALIARPIAGRGGDTVVAAKVGVATGIASAGIDDLLHKAGAAMYRTRGLPQKPPPAPPA